MQIRIIAARLTHMMQFRRRQNENAAHFHVLVAPGSGGFMTRSTSPGGAALMGAAVRNFPQALTLGAHMSGKTRAIPGLR